MLLCVLCTVPAFSQNKSKHHKPHDEMRKEVLEFKLKFLAQEMELREDQQKEFVTLYSQMDDEKQKLFRHTRDLERKIDKASAASDEEYEAVSRGLIEAKEKDAAIERKYDEKFAKFLTPKQRFKMKAAEEKFRRKMHDMRRKRRGGK